MTENSALADVKTNKKVLRQLFQKERLYQIHHFNGEKVEVETLGDNKQGILILVHEEVEGILSPSSEELLNKILASAKLRIEDVLVVNMKKAAPLNWTSLYRKYTFSKVISFGVDTGEIDLFIDINRYNIFTFYDVQIIIGHQLKKLQQSKKYKRQLWQALQKMFPEIGS